jgi:flagellar hook-length control protein FliK
MQLTPFGRLEIKLEDLPTITDDPRKTNSDFEKLFTKREPRKTVNKTEPSQADQEKGLPPTSPTPTLTPTHQPVAEKPQKPKEQGHTSDFTTPNQEGAEGFEDTLSLGNQGAKSRPTSAPQEKLSTRFKLSPGRALRPQEPILGASISAFPNQAQQLGSIKGDSNQSVSEVGRSNATHLGRAPGNKTKETQQHHKPQKAKTSYRSSDPKRAELAQTNRDSIFRQVTMALTQEGGSMFIAIAPPSLGHIALELKLDGDKLRLKIQAEHKEVTESLRQDLGHLKDLLLKQGMNVEEFDVRTGTQQEQAQGGADFEKSFGKTRGDGQDGMKAASSQETRLISPLRIHKGNGIDFIA